MILPAALAALPSLATSKKASGGQNALDSLAGPAQPPLDFKKLTNLLATLLGGWNAMPVANLAGNLATAAGPVAGTSAPTTKNGSNAAALAVISAEAIPQSARIVPATTNEVGSGQGTTVPAQRFLIANGGPPLPSLSQSANGGKTTIVPAALGNDADVLASSVSKDANTTLGTIGSGQSTGPASNDSSTAAYRYGLLRTTLQTAESPAATAAIVAGGAAGAALSAPLRSNLLTPGRSAEPTNDGSTPKPAIPTLTGESALLPNLLADRVSPVGPEAATSSWAIPAPETQQTKKATLEVTGGAEPSGTVTGPAPASAFASGSVAPQASAAEQVGNGILAHLATLSAQGRTDFRIHLNPPDLGPVRVHLSAADGQVSARLIVREDATRQLLQTQLDTLLQRLSGAGIALGRFDVSQEGAGSQWQGQEPQTPPVPNTVSVSPAAPVGGPNVVPAQNNGLIDVVA